MIPSDLTDQEEKLNNNSQLSTTDRSSHLRSKSKHKWYTLIALSTLYIASYHCILCIGALEHNMIIKYNLSNTEFSLFSTLSFLFATVGSLITPLLIQKINIYNTMLISTILVTFGQFIFILGIISSNLYVMYLGRIFIGIAYGTQNVTIYSTVNVWFKYNNWLSFALNTINSTYEIGVLTSRYALVPLYALTNELYAPYLVGILLGCMSIVSCIIMIRIEYNFIRHHFDILLSVETNIRSQNITDLDLQNDFSKIREIGINVWLIIAVIIIGWSSCETFGNLLTQPFMVTFNIDEKMVNILLSVQSFFALTVAQFWGWFNSKYGFLSHFLISSMLLMSLSVFLLFMNQMNLNDIENIHISSTVNMVLIVILYAVGLQQFFAVSFTCLALICPLELSSIVNSVAAIGFMSASAIESWLFGIIADGTSSYRWSVLMMIALTIVGLAISVVVHYNDIFQNGPLHEIKMNKIKYERKLMLPLSFAYVDIRNS